MNNTTTIPGPLAGLLLLCAALAAASAPAQAGKRPISDFLNAQGSFCLDATNSREGPPCDLFIPPSPNMVGWTVQPDYAIFAFVDYAGLQNKQLVSEGFGSLGTSMAGSVNEVRLADGRASVAVTLHTKNALAWVSDIREEFPGVLLFGHRLDEVKLGAAPALADCFLHVTFTNTAPGAPLPDLIQLAFVPMPGQAFKIEAIYCTGTGLMADGEPALMTVTQTGLFMTPGRGATADGYPVERVELRRIGRVAR